jgi:type VI secretion system protein ImpM
MSEPLASNAEQTDVAGPRIAGWYGKLPSLGDFATRRLSEDFVQPWDTWLCERISETKSLLGERWLSLYLSCPVWRFFAMPRAISERQQACWTGVLMASVDRVGRHFPLTIAAALPTAPATGAEIDRVWQWLSDIETVALAALDFEHTAEQLDAQLLTVPLDMPSVLSASALSAEVESGHARLAASTPWLFSDTDSFAAQLFQAVTPNCQAAVSGMSLWCAAYGDSGAIAEDCAAPADEAGKDVQPDAPAQRTYRVWPACGLPSDALFTSMLVHQTP